MKKFIIAAIAAVITLGGFSASAQNNKGTEPQKADKMYRPQQFTDFAFEGILLSVPQQARIDSLNNAMKAQCPNKKETCPNAEKCDKAKCDKAKCDKAKCDKAKCDKDGKNKDQKGQRPGMKKGEGPRGMNPEMKANYIGKVKEILTPEQYTTFLENIVLMQAPQQHKGMKPSNCEKAKQPKECKQGKDCKQAKDGKAKAEKTTK